MSSRSTSIVAIAGITLAGLVAYAVYFDYRRRTDGAFRKKLRKEKKIVDKTVKSQATVASSSDALGIDDLRAAMEKLRNEEVPQSIEEKEHYFMEQVGLGEQLASKGPPHYLEAALAFFRALRVYPSPVELIVIYQKTVPEPVFKLVMELTNLDVKERVEGYPKYFPPKSMNVTVEARDAVGTLGARKVLVATKDFASGDVIYKESPVVTVLDFDLEGKGTHCTHCLRVIDKGMGIKPANDPLKSIYCSKECHIKAGIQYNNLLFTLESALPPDVAAQNPTTPAENAARKKAQADFVSYIKGNTEHAALLLVAKFVSRQVAIETAKMLPAKTPSVGDFPEADGGDYGLYDHVERLRYLEVVPSVMEYKMLVEVLKSALPGLEQFITEERHAILLGKMSYNSYGVCYGGGRDDKPAPTVRPEQVEKSRTPYGTSRQIGRGFYLVSAYLSHSCVPSARPSFSTGTSELHLIATQPIKKGDEITVAYVDVTRHGGETPVACRRRRRTELARGWRFACMCSRCEEEGAQAGGTDNDMPLQKDESRVEAVVVRSEEGEDPANSVE